MPTTPAPPLDLTIVEFAPFTFHRVHPKAYGSTEFNASGGGNARFSPIHTPAGEIIPTIYGGSSFTCALMETAFHDVPYSKGPKRFSKARLDPLVHSTVITRRPLRLVDLSSIALRRLGITRKELIDTEADQYPHTRVWAEAIYAQDASADGLRWTSRQDDTSWAILLFGDRISRTDLVAAPAPRALLSRHTPKFWKSPSGSGAIFMTLL